MFAFKISLVLGAIYSLYKTLETVEQINQFGGEMNKNSIFLSIFTWAYMSLITAFYFWIPVWIVLWIARVI